MAVFSRHHIFFRKQTVPVGDFDSLPEHHFIASSFPPVADDVLHLAFPA
jgi:hypothetical protein